MALSGISFVGSSLAHHFLYFGWRVNGTSVTALIALGVAQVSWRHVATSLAQHCHGLQTRTLFPRLCTGVTCAASRFAIYDRGGASEPAVERRNTALHVTHTPWRRHPQNLSFEVALSGGTTLGQGMGERVASEPTTWRPSHLCAIVVFTGGTAMIQGINEHVANDLTELFP